MTRWKALLVLEGISLLSLTLAVYGNRPRPVAWQGRGTWAETAPASRVEVFVGWLQNADRVEIVAPNGYVTLYEGRKLREVAKELKALVEKKGTK